MQVLICFCFLFYVLFFFVSSGDSSCRFVFLVIRFFFFYLLLKSTFSVLHGVISLDGYTLGSSDCRVWAKPLAPWKVLEELKAVSLESQRCEMERQGPSRWNSGHYVVITMIIMTNYDIMIYIYIILYVYCYCIVWIIDITYHNIS